MRYLLVLAFVAVAYAGTVLPRQGLVGPPMSAKIDEYVANIMDNDGEIDLITDPEDGTVEVAPSFIISWQVRRAIRKMQKQMPCGWPQYGIPPLAPLKKREAEIHIKQGILETFDQLFRLRVDGLDDFKIKKLKLNVIFSKITFDFLFKNVKGSVQKYETDTLIDAMRQLGLSVQYEGDGSLDFGMRNLRVAGTLKYKLPVLWGSMRITSLKTTITVESVDSEISGFMGDSAINQMVNTHLESFVESSINNNQREISDLIEDNLVPRVNKMLKGNDFWTIIDLIFSSSDGESEDDPIVTKCESPADPWN